jgi:mannitol-1-phosphate 5-dehydrogenase
MIAVHFGAGNIGRGFIGQLLHQAGYKIIFLDVNQDLVSDLKTQDTYRVIETGVDAQVHEISNFTAFNSNEEYDLAAAAISSAQILTTSVGPNVLKFLAPLIISGLDLRSQSEPLVIMACENSIKATEMLRDELLALDSHAVSDAVFANTAVDRIVPLQQEGMGLDVLVESFSEWVIDASSLGTNIPTIPGAHFVENLSPFIERKLFTVNTGHATLAYVGQESGAETIVQAIKTPAVAEVMLRALAETSRVLVARHGFDEAEHKKYVEKTIQRFTNSDLDDPVTRVGREPARKLARHDRLVGPAAYLAELGDEPAALLEAIGAALVFKDASGKGVGELQAKLQNLSPEKFVSDVMGIEDPHPLAKKLTSLVKQVKLKNYS